MTSTASNRIISADDHMDLNVLPPTLWVDRLPAKFRDRAPRVVDTDEGPSWQANGQLIGPSGRKKSNNKDIHKLGYRPGDPTSRLQDMDKDGVYSSVIYGPPGGISFPDRETTDACISAYNDWANEFNAHDRNRLLALALLPGHTPEVATRELERAAKLGHRGAVIDLFESPETVFYESWERFWATANDAAIPIHFHLGGGMHSLKSRPGSWSMPARVSVIPMQLDEAVSGMIFSGILERHPKVKIVLGESGLGWIPYVLERMDHEYRNYYDMIRDYRIKEVPGFYWKRQMFATYEQDDFGLRHIDDIGVGNVMWASDYPHGDTTWPNSMQAIMDSPLGKLDEKSRRAIVCDNAARVYGIV